MAQYGTLKRMLDALGTEQIFAVPNVRGLDELGLNRAGANRQFRDAFLPMLIGIDAVRPRERAAGLDVSGMLGAGHEAELAISISKQYGIPYASFENKILKTEPNQNLGDFIDEAFARNNFVLPLFLDNNVLAVAISDPDNVLLLDGLKILTGKEIQLFISTKTQILKAIDEFYHGDGAVPRAPGSGKDVDAQGIGATSLVNAILKQAIQERATDVHIERSSEGVNIRFRIGGVLHERPSIGAAMFDSTTARIKTLARLNVDERRLPQEGSFSIKIQSLAVEMQVSTIGTEQGERVVLRLAYPAEPASGV